MTEQDYNKAEGIRRSELTKFAQSPAHAKYAMENPSEPTPAMILGTATHAYILEPDTFGEQFMVADFDARTKEGKALKQEAMDKGLTLITRENMDKIEAMAEAIRNNPYASRLLKGAHETSHFWIDRETGETCKCRTDCETDINGTHYIVDLKTCANASMEEFVRDALKFGYFVQAAMYTEGVRETTGQDSVFVFVAIEKDPPYAVNVLQCGENEIRLGMNGNSRYMGFRTLMDLYHKCKVEDKWPGYEGFDNLIYDIKLPKWMQEEPEEEPKAQAPEELKQEEPEYMTVQELADMLHINRSAAYALVKRPGFPAMRITPRKILIIRNKVGNWIAENAVM